jgi:hypothetical protein
VCQAHSHEFKSEFYQKKKKRRRRRRRRRKHLGQHLAHKYVNNVVKVRSKEEKILREMRKKSYFLQKKYK